MCIETLTAETPQGRQAIEAVMAASYRAGIDDVPPEWALARVVDGAPVSFILVDPHRQMAFPGGNLRYAFICDVATRKDRRLEGHFCAIMKAAFARLVEAGVSLVLTHGQHSLYRRFGFDVFTHHSGIFITPEQIARTLGAKPVKGAKHWLVTEQGTSYLDDRLIVTNVKAVTLDECKTALRAAATLARARGKGLILFEQPSAPSYGSAYPQHPTLETPLIALARTCGAEIRVQGADPENGTIPDADWIKVLDTAGLIRSAVACLEPAFPIPASILNFETDAGAVTLASTGTEIRITAATPTETPTIRWPSAALAQIVTGYRSAAVLDVIHNTVLPDSTLALLDALFPTGWRLSRNESWTYKV
jgi:hypothetical protein